MENNSFEVSAVDRHKTHCSQPGQAVYDADCNAGTAHTGDLLNGLHRHKSSGIALPTVEELHYAHYFLNRAAERRQEFSQAIVPHSSQ